MLPSLSHLTQHTGFRGTIKNSPSDFVVTEIPVPVPQHSVSDDQAEPLQKPSEVPPERSSPWLQPPKKSRTAPAGPEREPDPRTGPEGASPLDSLLGKSTSELLDQFARDLKDAWDLESGGDAGAGGFSLGPVLDKKDRAGLHSAVRQKFPFLVTVTKGKEMIVEGNADYRELRQLVTEKETSAFFKFLDAKLENSTFSFEPDGNKEHRKVVHHFINRKFGKLLETKSFTVTDVNDQPKMSIMVRFREKSWSRKRSADGFQEKQDLYTGKYYIFLVKVSGFVVFFSKTETQNHFCMIYRPG